MLGLCCCAEAFSRCSEWRLLFAVMSLVTEHRLQEHMGTVIVVLRLGRSMACDIFPDQGSNPLPVQAGRLLATLPPGKSRCGVSPGGDETFLY